MSEQPESNTSKPGSRRREVLLFALAVLGVVFSLYVLSQVAGVLYGIVLPPAPPLPESVEELDYTSEAYGVDAWVYSTELDACRVARFYDSQGECLFAPGICEGGFIQSDANIVQGDNVAQCSGTQEFSIFAMRWRAVVATGYRDGNPTRLRLSREVFWTGEIPRPTPTPVD